MTRAPAAATDLRSEHVCAYELGVCAKTDDPTRWESSSLHVRLTHERTTIALHRDNLKETLH